MKAPTRKARPTSEGLHYAFAFDAKSKRATLQMYGTIGGDWFGEGVTAKQVIEDLQKAGDVKTIEARINSPGGDVFEGFAIYNALVRHPAKVETHVDGEALSAASFIMQAGDTRYVAESSMVMIHNAWSVAFGDAAAMRKSADMLDKINGQLIDIYEARAGMDRQAVSDMMAAETWFTGKECVDCGLGDKLVENLKVAACPFDPTRYRNVPDWVMSKMRDEHGEVFTDEMRYRVQHARRSMQIRKQLTAGK